MNFEWEDALAAKGLTVKDLTSAVKNKLAKFRRLCKQLIQIDEEEDAELADSVNDEIEALDIEIAADITAITPAAAAAAPAPPAAAPPAAAPPAADAPKPDNSAAKAVGILAFLGGLGFVIYKVLNKGNGTK